MKYGSVDLWDMEQFYQATMILTWSSKKHCSLIFQRCVQIRTLSCEQDTEILEMGLQLCVHSYRRLS